MDFDVEELIEGLEEFWHKHNLDTEFTEEFVYEIVLPHLIAAEDHGYMRGFLHGSKVDTTPSINPYYKLLQERKK